MNEITQADRDAAAHFWQKSFEGDFYTLPQAFARHREQAIEQLEREKAVVYDLWEQQKEIALDYLADCNKAADRIEALQADNAKLRAVLAPFARHIGKVDALVTLKIGDATWTGTLTGQDFANAYHEVNLADPKYREWLALQETER